MTQEQKKVLDLVKLPLKLDIMSQFIFDANNNMVAETRGWGWLQYKSEPELMQDTLGQMIVDAFNKTYGGGQ